MINSEQGRIEGWTSGAFFHLFILRPTCHTCFCAPGIKRLIRFFKSAPPPPSFNHHSESITFSQLWDTSFPKVEKGWREFTYPSIYTSLLSIYLSTYLSKRLSVNLSGDVRISWLLFSLILSAYLAERGVERVEVKMPGLKTKKIPVFFWPFFWNHFGKNGNFFLRDS